MRRCVWSSSFDACRICVRSVNNRGLCAVAQAESLKYKLIGGLAVRRAAYGVMRFIMEAGAKGVEVVISGKLRGQRAKGVIFRDGYMIKSGNAVRDFVDIAVRGVLLRQGVLGIQLVDHVPARPAASRASRRRCPTSSRCSTPRSTRTLSRPSSVETTSVAVLNKINVKFVMSKLGGGAGGLVGLFDIQNLKKMRSFPILLNLPQL
jgi:small subunit ribosomal protein S3e